MEVKNPKTILRKKNTFGRSLPATPSLPMSAKTSSDSSRILSLTGIRLWDFRPPGIKAVDLVSLKLFYARQLYRELREMVNRVVNKKGPRDPKISIPALRRLIE
jgi:hypothetical protein